MKSSIAAWLAQLGFERYLDAFVAADIELDVLPDLTDADLEKLDVTLGDRKRMLRAIATRGLQETVAAPAVPNEAAGERRQLTVLFCDLVGSTALSEQLDAEDLRGVISAYHTRCAEVVSAYGGEIAQYLGDGVMVQFGFPQAHEDDAERGVRCALALIAAIAGLALPGGLRLRTRVGIATGTEVVGDVRGLSRDRASVTGNTPSLAARFQNLAEPDTVVIGALTRRLLGDAFALKPLGKHAVKGARDAVELWRVDTEKAGTSRFAARQTTAPSPFVGRAYEVGLLVDRWQNACGAEGQAVLLTAEAGFGKSRIVEEFLAASRADDAIVIRLQCSPHYAASALQPLRDFIERAADIAFTDAPADRFAKLAALDVRSPGSSVEIADALALLLALPGADDLPRVRELTIEQRKAFIFAALLARLAAFAEQRAVRIVIEDLHWVDPTTLEFITQIVEALVGQRILLVATARPEFVSPWAHYGHLTTLALNRLQRRAVEAMVAGVCGGKTLPDRVLTQIIERTDGVPLFVEELTKSVLESRAIEEGTDRFTLLERVAPLVIPETLRDALTARLDALPAVREVAQVGAVIGREFSKDLLSAVGELDAAALDEALERLVQSGLVLPKTTPAGAGFSFKHALVRDAAYDSLLRPKRQQFHLRAAEAIVGRFGARAAAEPEIVAQHFEEGAHTLEALPYWQRAAELAISRSAYREAAAHLRRALALVDRVEDGGATELDLRNRLGVVHCVLEGGRSHIARSEYERACSLALELPESAATFTALWGRCFCDYMSGRTQVARDEAAGLIELAERLGNPDLMLEALHASWAAAFHVGDIAHALETTARGVPIYDPARHHVHVTTFGHGHDAGVCGLGFGASALVLAGRIAEARRWIVRGETLAAELAHPFTRCAGGVHFAVARDLLGEYDAAIAVADRVVAEASRHDFVMPIGLGSMVAGAARISCGEREAGTKLLRGILEETSAAPNWRPFYEARLALEELAAGDAPAAETRIERVEASVRELGGCIGASEVERARGAILRARGAPRAVVARCIEAAAARARAEGALLWELRAAIDLFEVASEVSDAAASHDARTTLQTLLGRFDGGDAVLDVRRARALLDAGSPAVGSTNLRR